MPCGGAPPRPCRRACLLPPSSSPALSRCPSTLLLLPFGPVLGKTRSTFSWQNNTYSDLPETIWKPRCQPPKSPQPELPNDQSCGHNYVSAEGPVSHGNLIIALEWRGGRGSVGLQGTNRKPVLWARACMKAHRNTAHAKWTPGPNCAQATMAPRKPDTQFSHCCLLETSFIRQAELLPGKCHPQLSP